jgi:hypothetical protein
MSLVATTCAAAGLPAAATSNHENVSKTTSLRDKEKTSGGPWEDEIQCITCRARLVFQLVRAVVLAAKQGGGQGAHFAHTKFSSACEPLFLLQNSGSDATIRQVHVRVSEMPGAARRFLFKVSRTNRHLMRKVRNFGRFWLDFGDF